MNAARRSILRRDWPRGLNERRPGYYTWVHPLTGKEMVIGRVPYAVARNEAMQANSYVDSLKPSLLDRLTGSANTVAAAMAKMDTHANANTAKSARSLDKAITAALGNHPLHTLTVKDCADFIEAAAEKTPRSAQALRSRLMAICARAISLGWMDTNPAAMTRNPQARVKRERLTWEEFQAIYEAAPRVNEWLQHAMALAIVTGQDRSTIANMQRAHIADGCLTVWRQKTRETNQPVAIPLALRLDIFGVSLAELASRKTGVISKHLLHHVKPHRFAQPGAPVSLNTISKAFAKARDMALPGPWNGKPPSFHEQRALSLHLYEEQGGVETGVLFGWKKGSKMGEKYADRRGKEALRVRLG